MGSLSRALVSRMLTTQSEHRTRFPNTTMGLFMWLLNRHPSAAAGGSRVPVRHLYLTAQNEARLVVSTLQHDGYHSGAMILHSTTTERCTITVSLPSERADSLLQQQKEKVRAKRRTMGTPDSGAGENAETVGPQLVTDYLRMMSAASLTWARKSLKPCQCLRE